MKQGEPYFGEVERFRVTIESDGCDCDGPIHQGIEEFEMSYRDLATRIGLATMRHGSAHTVDVQEGEFNTHVQMVFSNKHDEGFSRTVISWESL